MDHIDTRTRIEKTIPIVEEMSLKVAEFKPYYAKLKLPLEPNVNHIGCIYAGSLFTLGEMAGGAIFHASFDNSIFIPIVKQISIRFRRMALTDVTVEVFLSEEEAEKIRQVAMKDGKADFDLSLEIKDAGNEVCSIVDGTWQIRKNRRDAPRG